MSFMLLLTSMHGIAATATAAGRLAIGLSIIARGAQRCVLAIAGTV